MEGKEERQLKREEIAKRVKERKERVRAHKPKEEHVLTGRLEVSEDLEKSLGQELERKIEAIQRREALKKDFSNLENNFISLQENISKIVDNTGKILDTSEAFALSKDFINYYHKYQELLKEAELIGIVEPGFEKKYHELYAKADDYEFVEIAQGRPFPETRYADEEGKVFYQWNPSNPDQYFTYSALSPDRTEVQGSISEDEVMDLLHNLGFESLEETSGLLTVKDLFLDVIIKRGHALPLWKDNPYLKEIKDETVQLQLRNMPEMEQLERDIKKATESANLAEYEAIITAMFTCITVILPIIVFIVYKIQVGSINDEIVELEAKKSSLVQELEEKKKELAEQRVEEVPLKQSIYTQMQSINTLFKPLKEALIKEEQAAEEDPYLSEEEKKTPKY